RLVGNNYRPAANWTRSSRGQRSVTGQMLDHRERVIFSSGALFEMLKAEIAGLDLGRESSFLCRARRKTYMRQRTIPKLSKLSTAGRAELLAIWTATIGKPPGFRASRELLASALAWQLQERKFGGLKPATMRKLWALARAQERRTPKLFQPAINI